MPEQTVGLNVRYDSDGRTLVADVGDIERAFRRLDNQTKKNRKGFQDTSKASRRLSDDLKAVGGVLGTVAKRLTAFAAIAGGAATAALVGMVKSGLQAADALGKTSDKLGVATEQLAGLRVAAERSGVAAGQFDTALQRLVRRTAEAAQGTGEAKNAIAALGLNASELVKLSPDQILGRIADAMQGVESQSQRVALAFKLFDTEGVALVNTLKNGSAGLEQFQERASVAGVTLDRATVASIERANDAMADLQLLQQGFSQQLAARFAPVLEHIANRLFAVAEEAGGMGKVAEQVFNFLVEGAAKVATAVDGIRAVWALVRASWLSGMELIAAGMKNLAKITQGLFQLPGISVFVSEEKQRSLDAWVSALATRQKELAEQAAAAWLDAESKVLNYGKTAEKLRLTLDEIERSSTAVTEIQVSGFERVTGSINGVAQAAKDAADANVAAAQQTANVWQRAGAQIGGAFERAFAGLIQGAIPIGGAGGFGSAISGAFSSAIAGSIFSGGSAGGGGGGRLGTLGGALAGIGGNINQLLLRGRSAVLGGLNNLGLSGVANFFGRSSANLARLPGGLAGGAAISGLAGFGGQQLASLLGLETGIGSAAGSVGGTLLGAKFGAIGGPIGAAAGALLGALGDTIFGGDGKKRFSVGVLQGSGIGADDADRLGRVRTAASGLRLQSYNRRAGSEGQRAADSLLQTILGLDELLTSAAGSAGIDVNLAGQTLRGINPDAGNRGAGAFFGLKGYNGVEGSLEDAAGQFVSSWLNSVNTQLPKRVREILRGVDGTAEELVAAFEQAISIDRLLDLDVVKRTEEALREFGKATEQSVFKAYDRLTEQVIEAAQGLDGTASSMQNLNAILTQQKATAAELAAAYQTVGIEIDAALGNTIQGIRESILNEEELYNLRRQQLADITSQIEQTVSPDTLRNLGLQADRLIGQVFGGLTPDQQQAQAQGFIDTATRIQELIDRQLQRGQAQLGERETGVRQAVDLELQNFGTTTQGATQNLVAFNQQLQLTAEEMARIREQLRSSGFGGGLRNIVAEVNR